MKAIKISAPPTETPGKIETIYLQGIKDKKSKEAEAREKLASVDKLVLDTLGITLPDAEENTLAKRIFFTKSSDIASGRFDSYHFKPYFLKLHQELDKSTFEIKRLKNISSKIISGFDARDFLETGIPYLRVGNVKPLRFDLSDVKYISDSEISKDIQLEVGDLLITRKGSFGQAVIVDESVLKAVISSEVFRIPLHSNINSHYLAIWLNTSVAQSIFDHIKTGGIMGHLTQDVLGNIKIPIPPPEIQKEIAERVEAIYHEAKLLREQGAAILKHAKTEVEKMILGGD